MSDCEHFREQCALMEDAANHLARAATAMVDNVAVEPVDDRESRYIELVNEACKKMQEVCYLFRAAAAVGDELTDRWEGKGQG